MTNLYFNNFNFKIYDHQSYDNYKILIIIYDDLKIRNHKIKNLILWLWIGKQKSPFVSLSKIYKSKVLWLSLLETFETIESPLTKKHEFSKVFRKKKFFFRKKNFFKKLFRKNFFPPPKKFYLMFVNFTWCLSILLDVCLNFTWCSSNKK